jgi:hypothetical protein
MNILNEVKDPSASVAPKTSHAQGSPLIAHVWPTTGELVSRRSHAWQRDGGAPVRGYYADRRTRQRIRPPRRLPATGRLVV